MTIQRRIGRSKDDSTSDPDLDDGMDSADEDDTAYLRVFNQTDEDDDDDEYESAQMDDSDSCDEYVSFWSMSNEVPEPDSPAMSTRSRKRQADGSSKDCQSSSKKKRK